MSSIHEGYSASLFILPLAASLGFFGCSSTSNDSGTGGRSSVAVGGAASGGSTGAGTGGSSTTSPMTSSAETGGSATGGKASTGGTSAATSVRSTGGAFATGGTDAIGTSSAPASGGRSSSNSGTVSGGTGGITMTGLGGTHNGTGFGGQGGVTSTQSVGGATVTGTRTVGGSTGQAGGATANGGVTALGGASGGGRTGTSSSFELTSTELVDGGTIPTDATCESTAASSLLPPLAWTGAPEGTKSFAMAFVDITLTGTTPPNANGFHSVMWDIPATVSSLPKGLPAGSPPAGIAGLETVKQKKAPSGEAWLGPCPNFPSTTRTKTDTYEFRLYALDVESLPSNTSSMSVQQIYNYLEGLPPLGVAILSGTSNAAATKLK